MRIKKTDIVKLQMNPTVLRSSVRSGIVIDAVRDRTQPNFPWAAVVHGNMIAVWIHEDDAIEIE